MLTSDIERLDIISEEPLVPDVSISGGGGVNLPRFP